MGWVQLAVVVFLLGIGAKMYNGWKTEAKLKGIAIAEKQILESVIDNAKDSERETKLLLAKRADVSKKIVATQEKRKAQYAAERKSNPVYYSWASAPVPASVLDELCQRTDPNHEVRGSACDLEPRAAVQTESTTATKIRNWISTRQRDLGPRVR